MLKSKGRILSFKYKSNLKNKLQEPFLSMHVVIYNEDGTYHHEDIDVKDLVLSKIYKNKISHRLIENLNMSNAGKKIQFKQNNISKTWSLLNEKDLIISDVGA